ncbi:MAG: D-aminoacyl-tRNA deacylase [Actinomycetota bacterium]
MRAVVQRVSDASVRVAGEIVASVGSGLLVLLGVHRDDSPDDGLRMADKIAHLRVFADEEGKVNRSVLDTGGSALVVSQFTLYGDTGRGRRPSFVDAARPEAAEPLVEAVAERLREHGVRTVTGAFGAHMEVALTNDGPVTILIESRKGG